MTTGVRVAWVSSRGASGGIARMGLVVGAAAPNSGTTEWTVLVAVTHWAPTNDESIPSTWPGTWRAAGLLLSVPANLLTVLT